MLKNVAGNLDSEFLTFSLFFDKEMLKFINGCVEWLAAPNLEALTMIGGIWF